MTVMTPQTDPVECQNVVPRQPKRRTARTAGRKLEFEVLYERRAWNSRRLTIAVTRLTIVERFYEAAGVDFSNDTIVNERFGIGSFGLGILPREKIQYRLYAL